MKFLIFLELLFAILFFIILVTQVMIPLALNRQTFPLFRGKRTVLINEITDLNTELDDQRLVDVVRDLRTERDKVLADQQTKSTANT